LLFPFTILKWQCAKLEWHSQQNRRLAKQPGNDVRQAALPVVRNGDGTSTIADMASRKVVGFKTESAH